MTDRTVSVASSWPDLAGRLVSEDGTRVHRLPVRVYYEDTDFSGVVYHGSYVRWCERGRSDFLRLAGNDHRRLLEGGSSGNSSGDSSGAIEPAALMVRRLTLDYLAPARIDDVLEVTTRVKDLTAATLVLDQRVSRGGTDLVRADVTIVLVTVSGRVLRIGKVLGNVFTA